MALVIVYIVLGILYESYIHPLTILSTLPSAGVGALLALMMLNTPFSLISLLGLFLLIGIVKKNAILMIDLAIQSVIQLYRVFFKNDKNPITSIGTIEKSNTITDEDDYTFFKTIRACFAAHPVNIK